MHVTTTDHFICTGLVNWFVSLRIWVPMSRLSYSISLSQFVFIAYSFASTRSIYDHDAYSMAKEIFVNTAGTFVVANIVFLLFEGPIISIFKRCTGLKRRSEVNGKRDFKSD